MTKKLIAIFAVMAISMFAVIAEVKPVGVEGHMLKCRSTQIGGDILVPTGSEKDIYLSDQYWDEAVTDEGDIPGFKRTETTLKFDRVYEDALKLLEPSNSFYMVVDTPERIVRARIWKSRGSSGKYYQKTVIWEKEESK